MEASKSSKQGDLTVSALLDLKKLQGKDPDYLFSENIIQAQYDEANMLETYLTEQELDEWSEEEFSLANRDIGPELLLNGKQL